MQKPESEQTSKQQLIEETLLQLVAGGREATLCSDDICIPIDLCEPGRCTCTAG